MKNTYLISILALVLVINIPESSAYINCTIPSCSGEYIDNGTSCQGSTCTRECHINICSGTWTQVHSSQFGWDGVTVDREESSSSSYASSNISSCYKFTYDGPDNSVYMYVSNPPSGDCDSETIGGFYDTVNTSNPWFQKIDDYLGNVDGTKFDYLLKRMRGHAQAGVSGFGDYSPDIRIDSEVYCAPNKPSCDLYNNESVTVCNTTCYNRSTKGYMAQGYLEDPTPSVDSELKNNAALYAWDGCGNSYVNGNHIFWAYFVVKTSPATNITYNNQQCTRTNEAPTVSNVNVYPSNPTAGDNLVCNYTYFDPENFEEKDSSYEWWKNSANQNINSRILNKGNLTVNDSWYCKVTPSDGLVNGTKTQSNNNVTISSTVNNVEFYINNQQVWNESNYVSGTRTVINFIDELNNVLLSCSQDENGLCNISLRFSSDDIGKLNLTMMNIYYGETELNLPSINSIEITPPQPYINETLDCAFNVTDADANDTLTVNVTWYKNNVNWVEDNENNLAVSNGQINHTTSTGDIESSDTSKGEYWICSVNAYDGTYWSGWTNSSSVRITGSTTIDSLIIDYGGYKLSSANYDVIFTLVDQPVAEQSSANYNLFLGWQYYKE
ncbi:hypothetical protein HQ529_04180 [Candidatus Woesearchaeota archaeon]|nr:hypothetical protein [Candidatus Woesearchaeota archaeon]